MIAEFNHIRIQHANSHTVSEIGGARLEFFVLGCSSDVHSSSSTDLPPGAENLVSVVVSVLEQEEDHDGQEQVLLVSIVLFISTLLYVRPRRPIRTSP